MGYELHITRADSWSENEGHWVTLDEWLAYVEADPELSLFPENGEAFAIWSGKASYEEPWLDWFEGNISTKGPDRAVLGKMLKIASDLGARVQGDEGELYDDIGDIPE